MARWIKSVRIIKGNDGVFASKKKTFAHSLLVLAKVHRLLESVLESVIRWFDWRRPRVQDWGKVVSWWWCWIIGSGKKIINHYLQVLFAAVFFCAWHLLPHVFCLWWHVCRLSRWVVRWTGCLTCFVRFCVEASRMQTSLNSAECDSQVHFNQWTWYCTKYY